MKALSLIVALFLCSVIGYSQNSGISNENSLLKVDYIGYSNGQVIFVLENKQNCQVTVEYKIGQGGQTTEVQILGNAFHYVSTPANPYQQVLIKARSKTFCGSNVDAGWVEFTMTVSPPLPIVFHEMSVVRISPTLIRINFEVEEDSELKHYNIRVSPDGKTWKTAQILFPNGITGRKNYSILVKL